MLAYLMVDEQAVQRARQMFARGRSEAEVREHFKELFFTDGDIDQIIQAARPATPAPPKPEEPPLVKPQLVSVGEKSAFTPPAPGLAQVPLTTPKVPVPTPAAPVSPSMATGPEAFHPAMPLIKVTPSKEFLAVEIPKKMIPKNPVTWGLLIATTASAFFSLVLGLTLGLRVVLG
jgi:hypothetical protein